MKKKVSVGTALIITVVLFIIVIIITKLFKLEELPIQTVGVLFGGVITALITYFLLLGQTQAEENKERNVKVFEKKSEKYENFIDEIWKVWEDRKIELDELVEIIKLFSKDIMFYASKKTSKSVLESLENIKNFTVPSSSSSEQKVISDIQKEVINIIKALSLDIDLGGEFDDEMTDKLNELEKAVMPALEKRNQTKEMKLYQNKFMAEVIKRFNDLDEGIDFDKVAYNPNNVGLFQGRINNSSVFFELYDLNKDDNNQHLGFKFMVLKDAPNYGAKGYKEGGHGKANWRQTTIKDSIARVNKMISFRVYEVFKKAVEKTEMNELIDEFVDTLVSHIKEWKNNSGMSIVEIIEDCEVNNK